MTGTQGPGLENRVNPNPYHKRQGASFLRGDEANQSSEATPTVDDFRSGKKTQAYGLAPAWLQQTPNTTYTTRRYGTWSLVGSDGFRGVKRTQWASDPEKGSRSVTPSRKQLRPRKQKQGQSPSPFEYEFFVQFEHDVYDEVFGEDSPPPSLACRAS